MAIEKERERERESVINDGPLICYVIPSGQH